jgi:hypothetical protein
MLEGVYLQAGKVASACFTPILLPLRDRKFSGGPDQAANSFL